MHLTSYYSLIGDPRTLSSVRESHSTVTLPLGGSAGPVHHLVHLIAVGKSVELMAQSGSRLLYGLVNLTLSLSFITDYPN